MLDINQREMITGHWNLDFTKKPWIGSGWINIERIPDNNLVTSDTTFNVVENLIKLLQNLNLNN